MPESAVSLSPKCPFHVLSHEGFGVRGARRQRRSQLITQRIGWGQLAQCIAHRDSYIAQPSHVPNAPDRPAFSAPQEFGFAPGKQLHQTRARQAISGVKVRQFATAGKFIPRANALTVITAVDAVSDQRPEFFVYRAGVLNGQVRDAPSRVQALRPYDGLSGANVHAGLATAAVRRDWLSRRESEIDVDLAQKEHGPRFAREDQRVFSAPALAAARRKLGFQDGGGICEYAVPERSNGLGNTLLQFLQPRSQNLMVVPAPGIYRNDALCRPALACPLDFLPILGRVAREIIHARRDHTHRAGHQFRRSGALEAMRGHVIHLAVKSVIKPGLQARFGTGQVNACHSNLGKPQFVGPRANTRHQNKRIDLNASQSHPSIVGNMPPSEIYWSSESDTSTFANRLATLPGLRNAYLELHGDLGAGKTTFVRHLLRALGVSGRVKSPTYAVVEPHETPDGLSIWHFDFYRFNDPQEWEDAGFRDLFASNGLKLAEWPEKAADLLPPPDLALIIDVMPGEVRRVGLRASTPLGIQLMEGLRS
ncbi:tRNA threonylcarbamoyl adenosine modification protein YjeE [Ottowia thiooxydans]|uniref:tRNA threonylcarbamoyladenosine biosynthesis protein TsaE n=1 Tax=Ottowia thiooxydans TaxID=219182 RepID=A0ABV2Q662_9BURK